MKELLELVQIVNKNKLKSIDVLGNESQLTTKVSELYQKISDGKVKSDKDAALELYGDGTQIRKAQEIKKRLLEKLYNTVLFIDVQRPKYDELGRAYYTAWKNFATAKILMAKGSSVASIKLCKKLLRQSEKYNFTELSINILRYLSLKSASHFFNAKEYKKYNAKIEKLQYQFDVELKVEAFYAQMLLDQKNLKGDKVPQKVKEFSRKYKEDIYSLNTYNIRLFYHMIRVASFQEERKFLESQNECLEALTFFRSSKKHSQNAIGIFQRQLFLLYWQQKKYEEGEALLKEARNYTRDGDISFFTNHSYYLLLCLHAGKYAKAWDIYQEATGHKRFSTLSEYSREKWTIYEAYLHYLGGLDRVPGMEPKKMRIQKFLNEVPIYSKDKSGTNIPILIIQILLLLLYQRYNEVIDRMEALEKYAQRYLRQPATLRSYYFIKMLLKIPVADFHRAGAIRKATPFRKKLDATPLNVTRQAYVTEIIPYERLWEFAMDSLQNTFWKPRKRSSGR
jgi:tetratricopeptide (TPR) repeat protein